jgi:hypothetical protein
MDTMTMGKMHTDMIPATAMATAEFTRARP